MSVLGLNKFTLDLEHTAGVLDDYRSEPDSVLARYRLSEEEKEGIRNLDADYLLTTGVNPIVLRNLLVILGVPHKEMYTHNK